MSTRPVVSDASIMRIRTSRIGLLTIHATAPIVAGEISDSDLTFTVRLDEVSTGNPLLDPEVHALIHEITTGTLTFTGQRDGDTFTGKATAGQISVPLDLSAHEGEGVVAVAGTSTFSDLHVPLPGMGHVQHLEVDIDGNLHLG